MQNDNTRLSHTVAVLERGRHGLFWFGLFLIAVGVLALVFPVASSMSINYFVALVLIVAGVGQVIGAFWIQGTGPFFGAFLLGLLTMAAGLYLWRNPAAGLMLLTLVVAVLFIIDGAFQMVMAVDLRPRHGWGWMFFSSLVSIAAGLFVTLGLQALSSVLLGLLFGINFLTTGLAFFMISRRLQPERLREAITQAD